MEDLNPTVSIVTYLSDAQWRDRLPKLPAGADDRGIREFLGRRRRSRAQATGAAPREHVTDIRTFGIRGNDAVVELSERAAAASNAAKIFTARVPAPSTAGGAAASAIDDQLMIVWGILVRWTRPGLRGFAARLILS